MGTGPADGAKKHRPVPPEQFDAIITNAGGCGSHLKHYAKLLAGDSARENRAQAWDWKVKDIHEWLVEIGIQPPPEDQPAQTVTYHESCHLATARRLPRSRENCEGDSEFAPGRTGGEQLVLRQRGHLQPHSAGDGRSTSGSENEPYSIDGAAIVATGNPGCLLQIINGAHREGLKLRVVHPVTLLAEAYRRSSAITHQ